MAIICVQAHSLAELSVDSSFLLHTMGWRGWGWRTKNGPLWYLSFLTTVLLLFQGPPCPSHDNVSASLLSLCTKKFNVGSQPHLREVALSS